ncbi:MAG: hypothetical protein JW827_03710 [Spirochaetes bacterium]|nr:hypothetical protein [Spirochaetota bacterium]
MDKLEFDGIVFRDIHEFVADLSNILTQMIQIFKDYLGQAERLAEGEKRNQLKALTYEKILQLQDQLIKKLEYVTDRTKDHITKDLRPKLMQFKILCQHSDLTKNTEETIEQLVDSYQNRVLEKKIAITGKIFTRKKE